MIIKMIKKANLLLLMVFLAACAAVSQKEDGGQEFRDVDSEFAPYLQDFIETTFPYYDQEALDTLTVGRRDIDEGSVVGFCKIFTTNGGREIVIDKGFWENQSEATKEALMLHEFAHCLCKLEHQHFEGNYEKKQNLSRTRGEKLKDGFFPDNCPVSILYPTVVSDRCFERHKEHYKYEVRIRCYSKATFNKRK